MPGARETLSRTPAFTSAIFIAVPIYFSSDRAMTTRWISEVPS